MNLHIVLDEDRHLRVSVQGNFGCEISRELLRRVRSYRRAGARAVHVDLGGVTQPSDCAIAALLRLSEMLGADFMLESCSEEVEALYVAGLIGESFPADVRATCLACLQGKEARCAKASGVAGEVVQVG